MHMKNFINLAVFGFLMASCGGSSDYSHSIDSTPRSITEQWYEGGSLHRATVGQWKIATDQNKLATCGDFVAAADKSVSSMTLLRIRAESLRKCIEGTTDVADHTSEDVKISVIAALCIKEMEYN